MKNLACVPKHLPASFLDIEKLYNFIYNSRKLLVVTGAGISTESGIPDYRSEGVGIYSRRANYKPIQQYEFVSNEPARKRYWIQNFIGWPVFSSKEPNITHFSLTKLEESGRLLCIVTQNVDNLHFRAKSRNVIELHGSAFRVKCLKCGTINDRHYFQRILKRLNPLISVETIVLNPDGVVDIEEGLSKNFIIPNCVHCNGLLQPDIVFFGGNVPQTKVNKINNHVEECDSLLILGSSLSVYSSYRIVLKAAELLKPIAIVNIGQTRGDKHATLKINARCGEVIPSAFDKVLLDFK